MSQKKIKYILGLMSGTSLDGIDLAYVGFEEEDYRNFKILKADTVAYSKEWRLKLEKAFESSAKGLVKLDMDYGDLLGRTTTDFIQKNAITEIDLIASHGHTIFHNPLEKYTCQIGNGAVLAAITNLPVIADFRTKDVALGGQGAPLVPIGDQLLFLEYDFCLNLGGFANISYSKNNTRIAFDICPVNIVMNHYARKLDLEYDEGGRIAAIGAVNKQLLNELNSLPFYKDVQPKSLGYEFVVDQIFPLIDSYQLKVQDVLRTFVEHVSEQISKVFFGDRDTKVLITGGGGFNTFLIKKLREKTNCDLVIPKKDLINYKEALIFALMGLLKESDQINCLSSVTGAIKDHSSGVIFTP